MSAIEIRGLIPLQGKLEIQGAKNAVLPMMAATLLHRGTTVIENVPSIADVDCMMKILQSLGCVCTLEERTLTVDAKHIIRTEIPEEYVGKMRSSMMVLGPLLSRMGEATTCFPGGCVLGKRPVDLHLMALRALRAEVYEAGGVILARAGRMKGARIDFSFPSVGATENAVMAAVLAEGVTELHGCAMEPEIEELCRFLVSMGANICGIGTGTLFIKGVEALHGTVYRLKADRICAGTYLAAAAATLGDVVVSGVPKEDLKAPLKVLLQMGAEIETSEKGMIPEIRLRMKGRPKGVSFVTGPYPAFPTDLQSPFLAAACVGTGISEITESVFEARFEAARILRQFGANIRLAGSRAVVEGRYPLKPAIVSAPDLRGGAALLIGALAAEGVSMIAGLSHIERGYEDVCRDLSLLGADIKRINL